MLAVEPQKFVTPFDPVVKALASGFSSPLEAFRFVSSLKYVREARDVWRLPRETLRLGCGDCEDLANLLTSILRAMGYPARSVVYRVVAGGREVYHVATRLGDTVLDPSVKKVNPGWLRYAEPILEYDEKGVYRVTGTPVELREALGYVKAVTPFALGLASAALAYKGLEPVDKRVAGAVAVAAGLGVGVASYYLLYPPKPLPKKKRGYVPGLGWVEYFDAWVTLENFIITFNRIGESTSLLVKGDLLTSEARSLCEKVLGVEGPRYTQVLAYKSNLHFMCSPGGEAFVWRARLYVDFAAPSGRPWERVIEFRPRSITIPILPQYSIDHRVSSKLQPGTRLVLKAGGVLLGGGWLGLPIKVLFTENKLLVRYIK